MIQRQNKTTSLGKIGG